MVVKYTNEEKVVKESSACIDGYTKIALDVDHLHLNQFKSSDDPSYKKVHPEIRKMVKEAPARIKRRLKCNVSLRSYQNVFTNYHN